LSDLAAEAPVKATRYCPRGNDAPRRADVRNVPVSYYLNVTTKAGTSSSVTATIGWTDEDDGQTLTAVTPSPANNNVGPTSVVTGMFLVDAEAGTNITYATTYASSGTPAMVYKLRLRVEAVPGGETGETAER
jgi:hypothetical protein